MHLIEARKGLLDRCGRLFAELRVDGGLAQTFLFRLQVPDSHGQLLKLPMLIVGKLEAAQQMAAHESALTRGLYDRRGDEISLDEVERIVI